MALFFELVDRYLEQKNNLVRTFGADFLPFVVRQQRNENIANLITSNFLTHNTYCTIFDTPEVPGTTQYPCPSCSGGGGGTEMGF